MQTQTQLQRHKISNNNNKNNKRVQMYITANWITIWCYFKLCILFLRDILDCYWPCRQKMIKIHTQRMNRDNRKRTKKSTHVEKKRTETNFIFRNKFTCCLNKFFILYGHSIRHWKRVPCTVSKYTHERKNSSSDSLLANEHMKAINNCKLTDFRLSFAEFRWLSLLLQTESIARFFLERCWKLETPKRMEI